MIANGVVSSRIPPSAEEATWPTRRDPFPGRPASGRPERPHAGRGAAPFSGNDSIDGGAADGIKLSPSDSCASVGRGEKGKQKSRNSLGSPCLFTPPSCMSRQTATPWLPTTRSSTRQGARVPDELSCFFFSFFFIY